MTKGRYYAIGREELALRRVTDAMGAAAQIAGALEWPVLGAVRLSDDLGPLLNVPIVKVLVEAHGPEDASAEIDQFLAAVDEIFRSVPAEINARSDGDDAA